MDWSLEGYRILDLTDERGLLAGKMLGDLGADVIKVEPPGGAACRHRGPFLGDKPDPDRSLHWFAFNTSKRGITLDIAKPAGRDLLLRLAARSDAVIESFGPGELERLGLGFDTLRAVNPRLVLTSISAFGQTGPYTGWQTDDLVNMAVGGHMFLTGDPSGPPLRISFPQSYLHAAGEGAVGTLLALYNAARRGRGQRVDVSAQAWVSTMLLFTVPYVQLWDEIVPRFGNNRPGHGKEPLCQTQIWRCRDGFVSTTILGGLIGAKTNAALVAWMRAEGRSTPLLDSMNWEQWDIASITQEDQDRIEEPIGKFFLDRTKAEIFAEAVRRRIQIYPICEIGEVVEQDAQLQSRGYWQDVAHPELNRSIRYPGPFARFSETASGIRRRAPLVGEHNAEVYGALGIDNVTLAGLVARGVV